MKSKYAERLSALMLERNIQSKELAYVIGVNIATINRWKNGRFQMYLANLIKVADFFNCSLEYILCRTDKMLDYVPRPCPPFYERLRQVMEERGKSRYSMTRETAIKDFYFVKWKNGSDPRIAALIEAADFLGVTLDYLVGRNR